MRTFWSSVHTLRGIAALMVVAHHIPAYLHTHGFPTFPTFELGAFGVDIFFAISGFVMYHTTANPHIGAKKFIKDRAIRIIPLYWLITLALGTASIILPSLFPNFRTGIDAIIKSLLFIPIYNDKGDIRPVLSMGWTLHYEMLFYFTTACLLYTNKRHLNTALTGSILIAALSLILAATAIDTAYSSLQLLAPLSAEFLFGTLIAHIITTTPIDKVTNRIKTNILLASTAAGLLLYSSDFAISTGMGRLVYWGIPGAIILYLSLAFEPIFKSLSEKIKTLTKLGDASYSIYLAHGLSFSVTYKVGEKIVALNEWIAPTLLFLGATAIGYMTHVVLEKPIQRYIKANFND